jgi:hypothetical protein
MVIGGMAAAFFLDKLQGTWTKLGIAIAGLVLGWVCYSIASNSYAPDPAQADQFFARSRSVMTRRPTVRCGKSRPAVSAVGRDVTKCA